MHQTTRIFIFIFSLDVVIACAYKRCLRAQDDQNNRKNVSKCTFM